MNIALCRLRDLVIVATALGMAACSNGRGSVDGDSAGGQAPPKVTLGGTVEGLAGTGLVLQNNGGDDLTVATSGRFTFQTAVDAGSPYSITVRTQPTGPAQSCSVANGAGTATANVTNVTVTCATGVFNVGGTVSGLAGSGLVLRNNGSDDLPIASNGSFTFATAVTSGGAYEVTVAAQPKAPAQTCTVADAAGTVGGEDVRTAKVTCSNNTYAIRGAVIGLEGSGLVLQNNGGDDIGVEANGSFVFPTAVASGARYDVTVKTQPSKPPQACSIANGSGTVPDGEVNNIVVRCVTAEYAIGGTVSGLVGSGLELVNNGSDVLRITANGPFTFADALPSRARYSVQVRSLPFPPLQFCDISNGVGEVGESDVTDISVVCRRLGQAVGGEVHGLSGPGLKLQNSDGEVLEIAANGKFTVPTSLSAGALYEISVAQQPTAQVCTVANGSGIIGTGDAKGVAVICEDRR